MSSAVQAVLSATVSLALTLVFAAAQVATASGRDSLAEAIALEDRDPPGALALLATVPQNDPLAARAAYESARITDALLRDLPAAAELYERYQEAHPTSPYASLAAARATYLRNNMGDSPLALAEFEAVTEGWGRHPDPTLISRMERLVFAFPTSPIRVRALFWLCNQRLGHGDADGALRWLTVLLAGQPPSSDAHRAELQVALIEKQRGRYAQAIAIDEHYLDSPDPLAHELAQVQLDAALSGRLYDRLFVAGLALLGLLLVSLAWQAFRHHAPLWPLPFEVQLFLPIATLLALVTFVEDHRVGLAVLGIAGGGSLLATLNGAYLRCSRPRGAWRLAYLGAMGGAAVSLGFCAIHGANLTDLVVTTLTQGADR